MTRVLNMLESGTANRRAVASQQRPKRPRWHPRSGKLLLSAVSSFEQRPSSSSPTSKLPSPSFIKQPNCHPPSSLQSSPPAQPSSSFPPRPVSAPNSNPPSPAPEPSSRSLATKLLSSPPPDPISTPTKMPPSTPTSKPPSAPASSTSASPSPTLLSQR